MSEITEKLIIGSDHGGYELKEYIKSELDKKDIPYQDIGTDSPDSVDYPNYGAQVAGAIVNGEYKRGILICGTGIGISIIANRFKGVRAALCCSVEMARLSREHNNANVLALGGTVFGKNLALSIAEVFLAEPFSQGERHIRRITKMMSFE